MLVTDSKGMVFCQTIPMDAPRSLGSSLLYKFRDKSGKRAGGLQKANFRVRRSGKVVFRTNGKAMNLREPESRDLVVTLRNAYSATPTFGCSIVPRKENLAAAQAVNDKWSQQPLRPGQRDRWLNEFRDAVGRQDITVHGIDPRSRAARILVEADYRMKLVGLGLEDGASQTHTQR